METYLADSVTLLQQAHLDEIRELIDRIAQAYREDRFVFIIGSGANACAALGIDIGSRRPDSTQRPYIAAIRNANHSEMGRVHSRAPPNGEIPLHKDGYADALDAIDDRVRVPVPQGPGLGVESDGEWVAAHCTALVVQE
jgi:hypothetical protein